MASCSSAMSDVIQSPSDKKSYRYLKLSNGISVLLIHDPAVADALAAEACKQDHGIDKTESAGGDGSGSSSSSASEDASMSEGDSSSSDEGCSDDSDSSEGGEARGAKGNMAGSKKAAAAMAVGVGSFSDPFDMPGLSHYLEHMLFMGSEKFPDENEYDAFLSKHGGSSNAFTELEFTNYHFEVAPGHLHGALDRFAQFFVAPLFKAGALEREVQAVDSEFSGVMQSDHSRLCQLMCHTSKAGHIYNKFSWGNAASLWQQPRAKGIDVRDRIMQYYREQYGPARMSLVLLGGQPLDELQSWVQQLFDNVPASTAGPPTAFKNAGMPFEGRMLYVAPAVKDHHEVTVTFQLPCLRDEYASKPDHYISHLVGHEGPGSLLSALKARGWVVELCAGVGDDGYSANTAAYLFTVSMTLTEAGLNAAPGCGLAPVALLFQHMRLLANTGPQRWVWDELASISAMKFRFLEEEDSCELVTRLASSMGWLPQQHLLVADYLHTHWKPDKVSELLRLLQPTTSCYRIDLLTKSFDSIKQQLHQAQTDTTSWLGNCTSHQHPGDGDAQTFRVQTFTEPWFNLEALAVPLPDSLVDSWAQAEISQDLALPPQNPYIPTDFELKADGQLAAAADHSQEQLPLDSIASWMLIQDAAAKPEVLLATPPQMILDDPGLRLWHKLAVSYQQPRTCAYFRLAGPAAAATPAAAVLGALWLRLVEETLAEDAYLADVAGLHWSCSPEGAAGFEVRMDGFSHKLDVLAAKVFDTLAACKVHEHMFPAVHEQLLRRYRNAMLQPSKAAAALRLHCLSGGPHWSFDELAETLQQIDNVQQVKAFAADFQSCCHLECLLLGNITASEAERLALHLRQTVTQQQGSSANSSSHGNSCVKLLHPGQRQQEQCVQLPAGVAWEHKAPARIPAEENCCVEAYYQIGMSTDLRLRVLTDLVDQIMYEPLYDTLRTKQQLGYTVSSGARLTHGVCGFCVVVVSAQFDADTVEARIEAFLEEFKSTLQNLSAAELARHKSALACNKLQRDTALAQEGDRYWEQVFSTRYEFLCKEQEVALMQHISLEELQQFFSTHLAPSSATRRKLVVSVRPAAHEARANAAQLQDIAPELQQQQQPVAPHVVHGQGMSDPAHAHLQHHHVPGAGGVVHAGKATPVVDNEQQQQHNDASLGQSPAGKRQRREQQKQQQATGDAASLLARGVQVQLLHDPDVFRQQQEKFPVYCTVQPVLAGKAGPVKPA